MDGPGELLSTVSLIQQIVGERLQVSQVGATKIVRLGEDHYTSNSVLEQGPTQTAEVAVLRVVDLGDTPGVDPGTDGLAVDLDLLLGANDRERHQRLQLYVR